MAVSRSNRGSRRSSSPAPRNTGTDVRAPGRSVSTPRVKITPPTPVIRNKPIANPVAKAREIANRSKTPIEKARATVSPVLPVKPTIPEPVPSPKQPFGCGTPGAGDWGLAAARNAQIREANTIYDPILKKVVLKEPPFYFVNVLMVNPELRAPVPTVMPCPNPNYVKEAPPMPPPPDPVAPITKSIITKIIDEIIEDSKEVVKEVETKQEPVREPVVVTQDVVRPPVPVTPIELSLIHI